MADKNTPFRATVQQVETTATLVMHGEMPTKRLKRAAAANGMGIHGAVLFQWMLLRPKRTNWRWMP